VKHGCNTHQTITKISDRGLSKSCASTRSEPSWQNGRRTSSVATVDGWLDRFFTHVGDIWLLFLNSQYYIDEHMLRMRCEFWFVLEARGFVLSWSRFAKFFLWLKFPCLTRSVAGMLKHTILWTNKKKKVSNLRSCMLTVNNCGSSS
jgi:hypothetical protein